MLVHGEYKFAGAGQADAFYQAIGARFARHPGIPEFNLLGNEFTHEVQVEMIVSDINVLQVVAAWLQGYFAALGPDAYKQTDRDGSK